jgi:hypothetical protein
LLLPLLVELEVLVWMGCIWEEWALLLLLALLSSAEPAPAGAPPAATDVPAPAPPVGCGGHARGITVAFGAALLFVLG